MKELEVCIDNSITATEAGYHADGIKIYSNSSNSLINLESVGI